MLIDVAARPDKYTGVVTGVNAAAKTVTVSAWYISDETTVPKTVTPAAGLQVTVRPNTKAWARNANIILLPSSNATRGLVCEFGMLEYGSGNQCYGVDVVNLGSVPNLAAFQARGLMTQGMLIDPGKQFGVVAQSTSVIGFYATAGAVAFQADCAASGFVVKGATGNAFEVRNPDGVFMTFTDKNGVVSLDKTSIQNVPANGRCNDIASTFIGPIVTALTVCNLPNPSGINALRKITVTNLSASTNSILWAGPVETGGGNLGAAPGVIFELQSDGSTWLISEKSTL